MARLFSTHGVEQMYAYVADYCEVPGSPHMHDQEPLYRVTLTRLPDHMMTITVCKRCRFYQMAEGVFLWHTYAEPWEIQSVKRIRP